jgi:soluble lytic murein transglycosylase-like protein
MQAVYSISAFILHSSWSQAEAELEKLKTLTLTGAIFLAAALPIAGQWEQPETTALEDSHQDLSLAEVVERFSQRLPAEHKQDAYKLGKTLVKLSERHMISPGILLSVIETESSYRYSVVSKAGAVGLMQLLPGTAAEVAQKYRIRGYHSAADLNNPVVNLELGVAYIAYLRGRFGHSLHYLAAYNMGPTALGSRIRRGEYNLGAINGYVQKIQGRTLALREGAQNGNGVAGQPLGRTRNLSETL